MHAYFIKANIIAGKVIEILATYDEKTLSGTGFNERKPDGTFIL